MTSDKFPSAKSFLNNLPKNVWLILDQKVDLTKHFEVPKPIVYFVRLYLFIVPHPYHKKSLFRTGVHQGFNFGTYYIWSQNPVV